MSKTQTPVKTASIAELRDETLRLIDEQQALLNDVLKSEVLSQESKGGLIDREQVEVWRNNLNAERGKVDRLEMTLAVVGTVKAGKSTTINAIVGTEIMPNRNKPMTTMPTLIRHKAGQRVPTLTFPAYARMDEALAQIKEKLEQIQTQGKLDAIAFYNEDDGKKIIDAILGGDSPQLNGTHTGPSQIFDFLSFINDITRLCAIPAIAVESPLDEYDSLEEFPVIEVEFAHLRNSKSEAAGQFTLVDTPGPNEEGQSERLTKLLEDQLETASGVLAVLDYTQLGAEADGKLRDALEKIARRCQGRLHVLVNKFDAKNIRNLNETATRKHVVHLLDGIDFPETSVYPVSSNFAYLANRALGELDATGVLPDYAENPWIEDVATLALGRNWTEKVNDAQAVRRDVETLWKDSLFQEPLDKVIEASHRQAAFLSIDAASKQLADVNEQLLNAIKMRHSALGMEVGKLKEEIDQLAKRVKEVETLKSQSKSRVDEIVKDFAKVTETLFGQAKATLEADLKSYQTGETESEEKPNALTKPGDSKRPSSNDLLGDFLAQFGGTLDHLFAPKRESKSRRGEPEIPPEGSRTFGESGDAANFARSVMKAIEGRFKENERRLQQTLAQVITQTSQKLNKETEEKLSGTLEEARKRLNKAFDVRLNFPVPNVRAITIDFDNFAYNDAVSIRTRTRSNTENFGKIRTWWYEFTNQAYSWEEIAGHTVNTTQMFDAAFKSLDSNLDDLNEQLRTLADTVLLGEVNNYLDRVTAYLESYVKELEKAQKDHQKSVADQEVLRKLLGSLTDRAAEQGEALTDFDKGLALETEGVAL